jgi:hypothetical protein
VQKNKKNGHSIKHVKLWIVSHTFNNFMRIFVSQILRLYQLTLPCKLNVASSLNTLLAVKTLSPLRLETK